MLKELITELDKTMKGITEASLSGELEISTTGVESTWEQDQMKKKKSTNVEQTIEES
jgi:hypothetical protein